MKVKKGMVNASVINHASVLASPGAKIPRRIASPKMMSSGMVQHYLAHAKVYTTLALPEEQQVRGDYRSDP